MERQLFISEETSTIAQIHFADFGYQESAKKAMDYLKRANTHTQSLWNPISRRKIAQRIDKVSHKCQYLLTYAERLAQFRGTQAQSIVEHVTKLVIVLVTHWNLSFIHSNLSYSLMELHSDLSSDLMRELESQQKRVVN